MKKIDLVHTTILIVAILAGYQSIQYVIGLLSAVAFAAEADMFRRATSQFVYTMILAISFAVLCVILVKNGRKYATLLLKDDPEASWEDAPKWDLDRRNILFALLIGIGLYSLMQTIPNLLNDFYTVFSDKVGSNMEASSRKDALIIELLKSLIGFLLIYTAPTLTNIIEKTIAVRLDTGESRS
jgi:hypothetical protein